MTEKKICFVVMGFGKKTDYQSGRILDLDKSYQYIIKPAALEAGLYCERADEIVHSGTIDVPMYDRLLTADVVIADISTSNPNAFYELGVRHALRPYTTVTIAEDKMIFPFDVSHLAINKYQHLGEGIDFAEVERMRKLLVTALTTILAAPKDDSPVYSFFTDLTPPIRKQIQKSVAQSAPGAARLVAAGTPDQTANDLMSRAEKARQQSDFATAVSLLTAVRLMAPNDPFIIQRLALATYKSQLPDPLQALRKAQSILSDLEPLESTDGETIGLWGAIHKRLWDLTGNRSDLETALLSYEKGFYLRSDYYSGINLAYLYNVRAAISEGAEAITDCVLAKRIRRRVMTICDTWLKAEEERQGRDAQAAHEEGWMDTEKQRRLEEKYWVIATKAEAAVGLGDDVSAQKYLEEARDLQPAAFMMETTKAQIASLKTLLNKC